MYKFYMKNGTAYFYERGVEIDGTVYGIHTDRDILRIKRSVVNNKFAETDDNFDMDTEISYTFDPGIMTLFIEGAYRTASLFCFSALRLRRLSPERTWQPEELPEKRS